MQANFCLVQSRLATASYYYSLKPAMPVTSSDVFLLSLGDGGQQTTKFTFSFLKLNIYYILMIYYIFCTLGLPNLVCEFWSPTIKKRIYNIYIWLKAKDVQISALKNRNHYSCVTPNTDKSSSQKIQSYQDFVFSAQ